MAAPSPEPHTPCAGGNSITQLEQPSFPSAGSVSLHDHMLAGRLTQIHQ